MTSSEILQELRIVLRDTKSPYLWADATLLRYLAEGQNKLCSDCGFFRDINTYKITTIAATQSYDIDLRIREIKEVRYLGATVHKFDPLLENNIHFFNGGVGAAPNLWTTTLETGKITFAPIPTGVIELQLIVDRYSLVEFSKTVNPELPADIHWGMIEWAAYKAYNHDDVEVPSDGRAILHKGNYNTYVAEGKRIARRGHGEAVGVSANPIYNLGC